MLFTKKRVKPSRVRRSTKGGLHAVWIQNTLAWSRDHDACPGIASAGTRADRETGEEGTEADRRTAHCHGWSSDCSKAAGGDCHKVARRRLQDQEITSSGLRNCVFCRRCKHG